jgi:hypothetical protein
MNKEFEVFGLKTGNTILATSFKLNCHDCGKTFAPLKVYMHAKDKTKYYLGTYCRLYMIIFLEEVALCSCMRKKLEDICVQNQITGEIDELSYLYIWMYDSKDDMEGKIYNEAG